MSEPGFFAVPLSLRKDFFDIVSRSVLNLEIDLSYILTDKAYAQKLYTAEEPDGKNKAGPAGFGISETVAYDGVNGCTDGKKDDDTAQSGDHGNWLYT